MGFSLKKFISFFLEPFTFGFFILLVAFIFLLFNSYKKAKIFLFIGLIYFFFISSSIFSNLLMLPLENQYKNQVNISNVEYILLLGGDFEKRAYEVIKLSNKLKKVKIITSGYAGNMLITDALYAKQELITLGIDENRIIMQEKPKDTIEEAISIKKLLGTKSFILVTSASHMPRAMKIFQSQGLNPIASPTAFTVKENKSNNYFNVNELKKVSMAIHEYLGLAWLKLKTIFNK